MLIFIIPLQSPRASKNWPHVSVLAQRTLRSVLRQTDQDFRVFLVCNEPPDLCPAHPALTILERDFPAPDMSVWENRMADKWGKVRVGLMAARRYASCHIMVVDADDCVSNRLSGLCAEHPESNGWFFDQGWFRDEGSRIIFKKKKDFDMVCGTSSIVRAGPDDLPTEEKGDRESIHILRSGHTKIRVNSVARGTPLEPLPFLGAVYCLATGENHTAFSLQGWRSKKIMLQKLLCYRLLTRRIRAEFGLYDLAKG